MVEHSARPRVLVTNDDGIESGFMRVLVEELVQHFEVHVAAPLREKSWIGRALTRIGEVSVQPCDELGCTAWALDGTPADCVNIALGHLIPRDQWPDVVVSGINLGFNSAMPYILSSGTVAGALEGVFWGIPGIALSHKVPHYAFEELQLNKARATGALAESLRAASARSVEWIHALAGRPLEGLTVHNVNFPDETALDTPLEYTQPGHLFAGPLFKREDNGAFTFSYREGEVINHAENTDRSCLLRGHISYGLLDFSRVGVDAATHPPVPKEPSFKASAD